MPYQATFDDLCLLSDFVSRDPDEPLFRHEPRAKETYRDFGEKIGGARKDRWRARGIAASDLAYMNSAERNKYVTKDNVWPKPNYKKLIESGTPRLVAYYYKKYRDMCPVRPCVRRAEAKDPAKVAAREEEYVKLVGAVRDAVMSTMDAEKVGRDLRDELSDAMKFCRSDARYHPFFDNALSPEAHLFYGVKDYRLLAGCDRDSLRYEMDRSRWNMGIEDLVDAEADFYRIEGAREIGTGRIGIDLSSAAVGTLVLEHDEVHGTLLSRAFAGGASGSYTWARVDMPFNSAREALSVGSWFATFHQRSENGSTAAMRNTVIACGKPTREAARQAAIMHLVQERDKAKTKKRQVRRGDLKPPILEKVERHAPEAYRHLFTREHATSGQYLTEFQFAGGEYGNWVTQQERVANLDAAYEAFKDLAIALGIEDSQIGLDGELSIAFGARGQGGQNAALAHYEPMRQVINLTKMRGAGSLAHEWIHAMDDIIGKRLCPPRYHQSNMMSEQSSAAMPPFMTNLLESLKWKKVGENTVAYTDFYERSRKADEGRSKKYWSTPHEMLARAGALYVKDRLEALGIRNDYLCGHAEFSIVPQGDERIAIDKAFDAFFGALRSEGHLMPNDSERSVALDARESPISACLEQTQAKPAFGPIADIRTAYETR